MTAPVAIVLAAGQGKRMKSDLPKVLHRACGRPIVEYVLDAARAAGVERLVVIVGHQAELVHEALGRHRDVQFARQVRQLGTGDAVKAARSAVGDHDGPVLVLAGDTPLLRSESLRTLLKEQSSRSAACVVGTARTAQNRGLGRIVRDADGVFQRIVEEKDANEEQKLIEEVNTGCYAFHGPDLFAALDELQPQNQQGEYYLTDCADILRRRGRPVAAACCFDIAEALGVNTPEQLAQVERVMQSR